VLPEPLVQVTPLKVLDLNIMLGVLSVIEHPFSFRMVHLIVITADEDVGRGRGGGCDVLEERRRLILLLYCVDKVCFDEVSEC
jgi:hypothetical protein